MRRQLAVRAAALLVRVGPGVGEAVPAAMGATRAATAQPVASASGRGLCSSGVAWEPQARGFASAAEPAAAADKLGLVVSEAAVARLKELGPGVVLRVMVEGGGCSGFQYEFSLDEAPREDDRVFERDGARVVCDDLSLEFLRGATVDYESDLMRSAFVINANPNAASSCGCGSSFVAK